MLFINEIIFHDNYLIALMLLWISKFKDETKLNRYGVIKNFNEAFIYF